VSENDNQRKNKRGQIVEAAARVFAQKGYSGAVVADIAVQAHIGKGTVYEYFKSKEDLFFAVFEWFQQKTAKAATVDISALGGGAAERLEALNHSLMNQWSEIKDAFVLVMEFWAASSSSQMRQRFKEAFRQVYEDYRSIVSALIRDGINRGEFRAEINPEAIAAALVGTWDALFLQAWFEAGFDPAATAREYLDTVLRGLKADDVQR
jgi:AcrR family transcriptional regulator